MIKFYSGPLLCVFAASLCCSLPAVAGEAIRDFGKMPAKANTTQHRRTAEAQASSEVYRDLTIKAGESIILDSKIDYSTLDRVAVSVRSDGRGEGANDLGNLTLKAYWSVPDADYYSATDVRSGKEFPYTTSGGMLFQTYGSQFRLVLKNEGETDFTLQQIIVFAQDL